MSIPLLASVLRVNERTLSRWLDESAQLRRVLCAKWSGKRWRIPLPRPVEYQRWLRDVRSIVESLLRPLKRKDQMAKVIEADLGTPYNGLEQEIRLLEQAMLQRASEVVQQDKASLADLRPIMAECAQMASFVCSKYKCAAKDAPKHFAEFIRWNNRRNEAHNAPQLAWLENNRLLGRAKQLRTEVPGAPLVAFIGRSRAGKPRVKLYRMPSTRRAAAKDRGQAGQWQKTRFLEAPIQLLSVLSEADIGEECERLLKCWPTVKQCQRARNGYLETWHKHKLCEAIIEVLSANKEPVGRNLAPLLFHNPQTEECWKLRQKEEQLNLAPTPKNCWRVRRQISQAREVQWSTLDCPLHCPYRERGISLSEFHKRYKRTDVEDAKAMVQRSTGYESEPRSLKTYYPDPKFDPTQDKPLEALEPADIYGDPCDRDPVKGMAILDSRGKPIDRVEPSMTPLDFKARENEEKRRRQLQAEFDTQVASRSPEDRQQLESIVGPFAVYRENLGRDSDRPRKLKPTDNPHQEKQRPNPKTR